jgi:ABC-type Fe3+-hydroxamate transport system substrate-binding protein
MDPITCCLLGICCPPFSAEQRQTFIEQLALHVGKEKAEKIADAAFDDFAKATKRIADLAA